jgi:hypothetical protein
MAVIGGGTINAGGAGWVRIVDIEPTAVGQGVVDKVWQDAAETVLQSCTASTLELRFTLAASYPKIAIAGIPFELPLAVDGGHYAGAVDVVLPAAGGVFVVVSTPDDADGARDTVDVVYAPPPVITALQFTGGYPGGQIEVKAGDTFDIVGTADRAVDAVEVLDLDAGAPTLITVPAGLTFNVPIPIADRGAAPQLLPAHVRVRDAVTGALSAVRATDQEGGTVEGVDLVTCNNFYFSAVWGLPTYPPTQAALKDIESATVPLISDYVQVGANTCAFDSPAAELSIVDPTLFQATKVVSRIAGGYNVSAVNLRVTMTRADNGAVSAALTTVAIAHDVPTVTITTPAARLRSGGMDGTTAQDHVITLTANQALLEAPSLVTDPGGQRGTFVEPAWVGSGAVWSRTLRVDEALPDEKGTFAWSGLVATNLAGRVQNAIVSGANYVLGGFVARSLTFGAYADTTTIQTLVGDFAKLTAGVFTATNQTAAKQAIGTAPPVTNGFTILAAGVNPTTLRWLDTTQVNANSSGTAQILAVQETV